MFRRQDDRKPPPGHRHYRRSRERGRSARASGWTDEASSRSTGGSAQEQFIVEALGDLRDMVVREIMTPRVDVVALSIPVTADTVTRAVRESGHGCFPVYGDDLDDLIGVLFVNDLFRAGWRVGNGYEETTGSGVETGVGTGDRATPGLIDISRRLRQPFLVPESRLVLDVLAEMRRQRRAFAVVVDEHGGVEGVLTIKDLLGALVGDLPDEFDPDDEPDVVRVDGNRWLVDGRMSVDEVRDRLGIDLPDGEYVTLGGFLFDGFGHIPAENEELAVGGWTLRVAEMDRRRVAKVVAKRIMSALPGDVPERDGGDGPKGDHTVVG